MASCIVSSLTSWMQVEAGYSFVANAVEVAYLSH